MKKDHVEIVVRVNDLDGCRIFYREVLQLGDPVLDSEFIASFNISGSAMLTLEKTDAPFLEHAGAATTWRIGVRDLDALRERMRFAGYELKTQDLVFQDQMERLMSISSLTHPQFLMVRKSYRSPVRQRQLQMETLQLHLSNRFRWQRGLPSKVRLQQ